ncbi:MAG: TRAP transporter permease [Eubacteriales bacterium]|nr:TRAP transporter permease [Eubacteriales bacterium]
MKRDPEKDPKIIDPVPGTADADVGSAAEVDEIMRKFDRESNTRVWEGVPKIIVNCITVAFALFCIYVTLFANFMEQIRLSSFLGLVVLIGFLTYPAKKGKVRVNYMPWYDILLMVLGTGAFLFYTFNAQTVVKLNMRITRDMLYIVTGAIGMLVLAELCRRSVGLPILCVAGVFMVYTLVNLWSKGGIPLVVYKLFYGDSGVLSTPINVCSKYIVVFIIFGAFLERTGISDFFISLANSLCGRFAGGPAKVAVVSSALCGMVSGSSVGNTVTTGSVTIQMMKKTGYRPEFAGAVEASASTGGQIMPPIMGAAAFLMAEYVGVPYSNIIVRAILPAVLYFLGIFIAVHLEAKKLGLKGIPKELLPRMRQLIKESYLLLPLIILIYLVCSNTKTMQFSAAIAILAAIGVGIIRNVLHSGNARRFVKRVGWLPVIIVVLGIAWVFYGEVVYGFLAMIIGQQMGAHNDKMAWMAAYAKYTANNEDAEAAAEVAPEAGSKKLFIETVKDAFGNNGGFSAKSIFASLEAGGRGVITVAVACGIAGVIAGCLTVTGLASKLINIIVGISGSSSLLALVLTMLCCIVLGMGVPTTANYCIMASTCAPILIKMGIPTIAAHFFVFYFGIVADITPPVALAAYAGSAIAKGNPMKTGITATRLAIAAFIIPFVFAYSPSILFVGDVVWYNVILIALTATIGMVGVAAGLSGYLVRPMNVVERVLTIAGGLCLIVPGTLTDVIGLALIALGVVLQIVLSKKKTA